MSNINWDQTEYLFALFNKNTDAVEFFKDKPSTTSCEECWMVSSSEILYFKGSWVLVDKPVTSPIYTQEMRDNGELPPIGSECVFFDDNGFDFNFDWSNGDKLTCLFYSTDDNGDPIGVYRHKSGVTVSLILKLIKPITPPIELIDGERYEFDYPERTKPVLGYYSEQHEDFNVNGTLYNPRMCTNIKLLEVKS